MKSYIIAGPTASGKSSFAFELSEKINGSIINADSKQVYNILPILTAQPKNLENHYLYNYFPHENRIDLMIWIKDAIKVIEEVLSNGKIPIIVGGTGFYLNALKEGFIQIPDVEYESQLEMLSNEELYNKANSLDSELNINAQDRYRLIRSINVFNGTKKPYSWWGKQTKTKLINLDFHSIYISKNKNEIMKSAIKRLDSMFPNVLTEVQSLFDQYNTYDKIPKHIKYIIGVEEIYKFFNKEITSQEMKNLILIRTMQYAKQQRTWFKNKMRFDEIID